MKYNIEELLPIVAKLTDKYTSKESTSVSYNTARTLMEAVVYCIEQNEKPASFSDTNYDLSVIGRMDANTAYESGYSCIIQKVKKANELFSSIAENFCAYQNKCYYDTIIKGMPSFFLYYDPKFNPQNHILTLDYPTIKPIHELCGIDAIHQYLQYIELEQMFLRVWPKETIIELLLRFHNDYEELIINICSLVLRNVLGCMIADKNISTLKLENSDYNQIREFVLDQSNLDMEEKILPMLHLLIQYGYEGNEKLYDYLSFYVKDFITELKNAVKYNCLEVIF